MTDQATTHDDDRSPTWIVQSVFDPDGGGHELAYTIGLHDLGHPELHLWARPSLGTDPGEDWIFSPADRTGILNEFAGMLLEGRLGVGSELERRYDGGEATVGFRVDPPGDAEELEAFHVDRHAQVLPIRWWLRRRPEGPPQSLRGAAARRARESLLAIRSELADGLTAPAGWGVATGKVSWRIDQRYGPLTPLVVARAAQLWQADVTSFNVLLRAASDVMQGGSLSWPSTLALAAARRAGRTRQLARLHDDVHDLVDQLTFGERWRQRWEDVEVSLWGLEIVGDTELAHRAAESDRRLLAEVTEACLLAEAVSDVLDPGVLVAARGPWDVGLRGHLDVPIDRRASDEVIAVVVDLLRPLPVHALHELVGRHRAAEGGGSAGDEAYALVAARLRGWALTTPAACPWEGTLDELPAWHASWSAALGAAVHVETPPFPDLHEWASMVTAALSHRARLSSEDVRTLCRPVRSLVPGLEPALNRPIVAAPSEQ